MKVELERDESYKRLAVEADHWVERGIVIAARGLGGCSGVIVGLVKIFH